jgi:hypothetical protein
MTAIGVRKIANGPLRPPSTSAATSKTRHERRSAGAASRTKHARLAMCHWAWVMFEIVLHEFGRAR